MSIKKGVTIAYGTRRFVREIIKIPHGATLRRIIQKEGRFSTVILRYQDRVERWMLKHEYGETFSPLYCVARWVRTKPATRFAFHIHSMRDGFWLRFFGWGVSIAKSPPHFSERYGYDRVIRCGAWRIKFLPRK